MCKPRVVATISSSRPSFVKSVTINENAELAKGKTRQTGKVSPVNLSPLFEFVLLLSIGTRQIKQTFPNVPKTISFFPSRSRSPTEQQFRQSWLSVPVKTTGQFKLSLRIFLNEENKVDDFYRPTTSFSVLTDKRLPVQERCKREEVALHLVRSNHCRTIQIEWKYTFSFFTFLRSMIVIK